MGKKITNIKNLTGIPIKNTVATKNPIRRLKKFVITQAAGTNLSGTMNCFVIPEFSTRETADSCSDADRQNQGSIPEITKAVKLLTAAGIIYLNTKDITNEINSGVITDHNKPQAVLEYRFRKFFMAKVLSSLPFVKNNFAISNLSFIINSTCLHYCGNFEVGKIFDKWFLRQPYAFGALGGVEPPHLSALAPHANVSAIPPPAQKYPEIIS